MHKNKLTTLLMIFSLVIISVGCSGSSGQSTDDSPKGAVTIVNNSGSENTDINRKFISLLTESKTTQYFTEEEIPETDIKTILQVGINTPSAMNQQPWHFSAVARKEFLQQLANEMAGSMSMPPAGGNSGTSDTSDPAGPSRAANKAGLDDAPLVIIVSTPTGSEFDGGLACQNMSVAALSLGYGTKIMTSPTLALNGDKQEEYRNYLGIPQNMNAVAVLLIGVPDTTVDGTTGPTTRNSIDQMTSIVK